jgi:hypothetical protein
VSNKIIFAVDGTIPEGEFGIVALDDGRVFYTTPVGCFTRYRKRDGSLALEKGAPRRGRKPRKK